MMKNSVSGIITAFLAGAAVGALIGILYAPDKGAVTRARLKAIGRNSARILQIAWKRSGKNSQGRKALQGRKPRAPDVAGSPVLKKKGDEY